MCNLSFNHYCQWIGLNILSANAGPHHLVHQLLIYGCYVCIEPMEGGVNYVAVNLAMGLQYRPMGMCVS